MAVRLFWLISICCWYIVQSKRVYFGGDITGHGWMSLRPAVHSKRIDLIHLFVFTFTVDKYDKDDSPQRLLKKGASIDTVEKELKETSHKETGKVDVPPPKVGALKKALVYFLLGGSDMIFTKTIVGTEQLLHQKWHNQMTQNHIPQSIQNVADQLFINPALDVYERAALKGCEAMENCIANQYDLKNSKRKHKSVNVDRLAKLSPPQRKGGFKKAAFVKTVDVIGNKLILCWIGKKRKWKKKYINFVTGFRIA